MDYENIDKLKNILYKIDPMGISDGGINEYLPEAEDIAHKINMCKDDSDLRELVQSVFLFWFDESLPDDVLNRIVTEINN